MIRKIILLTVGLVFISQSGICQIERPNKAYGEFNVQVSQSDTVGYTYNYSIKNAEDSEQVLVSFSIAIKDRSFYRKTIQSPPNKKWYIDGLAKVYITGSAAARILELPPENGLSPGEEMEISFSSEGLPAINEFYTRGFVEPFTDELIDSLFEAGYTEDEIFIDWQDESFKGFTISPKVWPEEVDTDVFLDSLESYRFRSCGELGWANDPAVCSNLEDRLNGISASLSAGDSLTAANVLAEFVDIVKAEKTVSLTSEGYALLYFNGQYLLERLDGERPGKGNNRKDQNR